MRGKNTYAKRQQEMRKKQKAQDKRSRRQKRKESSPAAGAPEDADRGADGPQSDTA